jgi:hypothetical protein
MRSENLDEKRQGPAPEGGEAWLRRRLQPDPRQVARVVRHALGGEPSPAGGRSPVWWLGTATAVTLLAMAFLGLDLLRPHPTQRSGETVRSGATTALITNASGRVEIITPRAPLQRGAEPEGDPAPQGWTVRLFNSDGCLCAMLPNGPVRYYIIGGDV